jgi:multiple sugar transport system substrate-binding protein
MLTRTRTKLLAACLALIAVSVLSACGSSNRNQSDAAAVSYWAVSMAPTVTADEATLKKELATFTDQTGVTVDLQVLGWADLYTRLMTAVTSGRGPDVIDIGNTWSASLQATGAFLPFDEQAMAAVGGRERFIPACLSATGAAGQPPASIPLYGQSYGLYYNTKMFAAAGIARPPATWAEFVADAKALTKPGQWGIGLLGASAAGNAQLAFMLGRQNGAQLFAQNGHPQFDTAAEQAAVSRLLGLMTTDKVVNPSDAEHGGLHDALAALTQGTAAMVPYQSSGRAYFSSVGFSDYAVAPMPVLDPLPPGGAAVQSFVAGTNVAVFRNTAHKDASLQLVRFLTSEPAQVRLNKAFGTLPTVTSANSATTFADPTTQTFATILGDHAETMPMVPGEAQMETLLGGAINNLWATAATGNDVTSTDIAAALRRASQQMPAAR